MPWHNCWHCTSVKSDNVLIYPKQCQTFLNLHALRMAWIWRLMLMAPGEDFLDVIAKVLSPTDNIDYKLLLWHPDIPGSLALYQEVTKTLYLGSVNCLDFILLPFFLTLINSINSPYILCFPKLPISLLTLFWGKWDIGMQAGEPIYWHQGDKSFCPNLATFNVHPSLTTHPLWFEL